MGEVIVGVTLFFVGIDRGDLPLNDEFKTFHPFEDNLHRGGPDVVVRLPFEGADLVELDRHTFGSVGSIVGKGKLQFGVLRGTGAPPEPEGPAADISSSESESCGGRGG